MSILKYKDPKTGEFKRINPYKAELSFVGKDGIVVNKEANSEEVEISGSGLVQNYNGPKGYYRAYVTDYTNWNTNMIIRQEGDNSANTILQRKADGSGEIVMPKTPIDLSITNKKYVNDNYVGKLKFANLEQALNGYILDTTKEAYADLDSAVLKNSVAVGDNVYPIADKTRALVTRIEGKTTKMVQLLDKSTYSATQTKSGITATNNGDGSWTINGTATEGSFLNFSEELSLDGGHKVLLTGNKTNSGFALGLLNQNIRDFGNGGVGNIKADSGKSWGIVWESGAVINNVTITPQLFDLTAMNREDITSAEQFKAEFPDLYPYENGNIYPAKISGVKFTGKNLLKLKLSSTNKCTANIEDDVLKITPTTSNAGDSVFAEVKTHLKAGEYVLSSISENQNTTPTQFIVSKGQYGENNITTICPKGTKFTLDSESDIYILIYPCLHSALPFKAMSVQIQIQAGTAPTAYEPYIDPVSVTLPETYDLHGIGDYKDYLEIIKNENNELYTLKKVQSFEVNESEKTVTPLATPVETVIATNLTYEQVTAIRHNGGLIEVEGNTNKGYAKPTVTNTIVYRLTAANTAEV
nr:MAG TPA: hypothetical protein [Caudoviricetes sp.]